MPLTILQMQQFTVASGLVVTVEADNESITIRDGRVSGSGASMVDPVAIAPAPNPQDVLDRADIFRLSAADATTVRMERADFERVMPYLEQPTVVAHALSISRDLRGHMLSFPDGRLPRVGVTLDQQRINALQPYPRAGGAAFIGRCGHCAEIVFVGTA